MQAAPIRTGKAKAAAFSKGRFERCSENKENTIPITSRTTDGKSKVNEERRFSSLPAINSERLARIKNIGQPFEKSSGIFLSIKSAE